MAEATKYSTSYAAMATTALSGAVRARERGGLRREAVWRCCGKDAVAGGVACAVRRAGRGQGGAAGGGQGRGIHQDDTRKERRRQGCRVMVTARDREPGWRRGLQDVVFRTRVYCACIRMIYGISSSVRTRVPLNTITRGTTFFFE